MHMKRRISHTLLNAVQRLAGAPEHTLSRVAARFNVALRSEPSVHPAPEHVMTRLESVFEALSELSFQPHVTAAFELACDTLQAELPTEAVAAGLYDIDSDEIRIVAARGLEHERLRGMVMSRERGLVGRASEQAIIISGGADGPDWLGSGSDGSTALLCPIFQDAHLLGVLALANPLCSADFNQHDLELVRYVADQLAGVIQTDRLRPSIASSATADRG